jgi:hypothetical protein
LFAYFNRTTFSSVFQSAFQTKEVDTTDGEQRNFWYKKANTNPGFSRGNAFFNGPRVDKT